MGARLAGMGALLGIHMTFTVCWPLFEIFGWCLTCSLVLLPWFATFGQRRALKKDGKTCILDLFGPDVSRPPETAQLLRIKNAIDVSRVVVCSGSEVAEVLIDPLRCETINRHWMVAGIACVRQATGRRFKKALQTADKIHICRAAGCAEGGGLHITCFGVLSGTDEVDVYEVLDRGVWSWALAPCAASLCWSASR